MAKPLRPDALPITEDELAFVSLTDSDIRQSAKNLSFDRERMSQRVDGGPWAMIVQAHLYHDHILTLTLTENILRSSSLNLERMSFAQKIDLSHALGLVPDDLFSFWKKLNKVRNRIAHDLDYEVTDDEVSGLKAALPKGLRAMTDIGGYKPDRPMTLQEVLISTIYYADQTRQALAGERLISKKYSLMVRATVAGQDYRFDPSNP